MIAACRYEIAGGSLSYDRGQVKIKQRSYGYRGGAIAVGAIIGHCQGDIKDPAICKDMSGVRVAACTSIIKIPGIGNGAIPGFHGGCERYIFTFHRGDWQPGKVHSSDRITEVRYSDGVGGCACRTAVIGSQRDGIFARRGVGIGERIPCAGITVPKIPRIGDGCGAGGCAGKCNFLIFIRVEWAEGEIHIGNRFTGLAAAKEIHHSPKHISPVIDIGKPFHRPGEEDGFKGPVVKAGAVEKPGGIPFEGIGCSACGSLDHIIRVE